MRVDLLASKPLGFRMVLHAFYELESGNNAKAVRVFRSGIFFSLFIRAVKHYSRTQESSVWSFALFPSGLRRQEDEWTSRDASDKNMAAAFSRGAHDARPTPCSTVCANEKKSRRVAANEALEWRKQVHHVKSICVHACTQRGRWLLEGFPFACCAIRITLSVH